MSDGIFWEMKEGYEPPYDPKLRKATPMMKMIIDGLKNIFNQETGLEIDSNTQLILSSCHGELSPTFEYLRDSATRNWMRPFLFQNSLHHSTTGFISQYFQILGPAYSVCGIEDAQESAICLGLSQMMVQPQPTLFIHAEYFPEELVEVSDYEAIRQCHILYLGNNKTKLKVEIVDSEKSENQPDTLFKEIGQAMANKKSSIKINLKQGRSFHLHFDYP